ncbi:hypothetical protein ACWIGW_34980 [Nocardia brasiliensis]
MSDKEFADLKGQLLHGAPVDPVTPSPRDDNRDTSPKAPDRRVPLLLVLAAAAFTAPALRIGRNGVGRALAAPEPAGQAGRGKAFGSFGGLIMQVDQEDQSNEITVAEPFGGVGDSYTVHLLPDRRVDGVTVYQDGRVIVETLFQQDGSWLVWVDDNSYYRIEEDGTVHKPIPSTGEVLEDNVDYASELASKLKLSNLQKMLALLGALAGGLPNRQLPPGFGPGVVPKPEPPGTSPVPGYSYSHNYGTNNFGITAEVDQNGVLDYVIEAGPDSPVKGSKMFEDMWNAVGPNVTAINGTWVNKPREGVVTNLQSFNNAIAEGATPQQAAFSTFAGKMAFRHGFPVRGDHKNETRRPRPVYRRGGNFHPMSWNEKIIQELQVRAVLGANGVELSSWLRDELAKDSSGFTHFRYVSCMNPALGVPIRVLKNTYDWIGFEPDGNLTDDELNTLLSPYLPGVPR